MNREIPAALAQELAMVCGALMDTQADVRPGAPAEGAHWVIDVVASDAAPIAALAVNADAAAAMTSIVMGLNEAAPGEAVIDTLREIMSQALSALSLKPIARGATWKVGGVTRRDSLTLPAEWQAFAITTATVPQPLTLVTWGTFAPSPAAVAASVSSNVASGRASTVTPVGATDPAADRIDVILDIDLPLIVRFGRTELPLRNLVRIGPGSLIDLGRSPDDPVEILVSNRVVAHGEVVIVSGNYGIRIVDVVSPRDRITSLGE